MAWARAIAECAVGVHAALLIEEQLAGCLYAPIARLVGGEWAAHVVKACAVGCSDAHVSC